MEPRFTIGMQDAALNLNSYNKEAPRKGGASNSAVADRDPHYNEQDAGAPDGALGD